MFLFYVSVFSCFSFLLLFLIVVFSVDLFSYPSSSPLAHLSPHTATLFFFFLIIISHFHYIFLVHVHLVFIQPIFVIFFSFFFSSLYISCVVVIIETRTVAFIAQDFTTVCLNSCNVCSVFFEHILLLCHSKKGWPYIVTYF